MLTIKQFQLKDIFNAKTREALKLNISCFLQHKHNMERFGAEVEAERYIEEMNGGFEELLSNSFGRDIKEKVEDYNSFKNKNTLLISQMIHNARKGNLELEQDVKIIKNINTFKECTGLINILNQNIRYENKANGKSLRMESVRDDLHVLAAIIKREPENTKRHYTLKGRLVKKINQEHRANHWKKTTFDKSYFLDDVTNNSLFGFSDKYEVSNLKRQAKGMINAQDAMRDGIDMGIFNFVKVAVGGHWSAAQDDAKFQQRNMHMTWFVAKLAGMTSREDVIEFMTNKTNLQILKDSSIKIQKRDEQLKSAAAKELQNEIKNTEVDQKREVRKQQEERVRVKRRRGMRLEPEHAKGLRPEGM